MKCWEMSQGAMRKELEASHVQHGNAIDFNLFAFRHYCIPLATSTYTL